MCDTAVSGAKKQPADMPSVEENDGLHSAWLSDFDSQKLHKARLAEEQRQCAEANERMQKAKVVEVHLFLEKAKRWKVQHDRLIGAQNGSQRPKPEVMISAQKVPDAVEAEKGDMGARNTSKPYSNRIVSTRARTHARSHACTRARTHARLHLHARMHACTHRCMFGRSCVRACVRACVHACVRACRACTHMHAVRVAVTTAMTNDNTGNIAK